MVTSIGNFKGNKNLSSTLRFLSKLRPNLNVNVAKMIYLSIVIPVFTYCEIVNLNLLGTKYDRFHERVVGIITKTKSVKLTPIMNYEKRHACQIARTSITRKLPAPMTNYFKLSSDLKSTRNKKTLDSITKSQNKSSSKWILLSRCNYVQEIIFVCKKMKICFSKDYIISTF